MGWLELFEQDVKTLNTNNNGELQSTVLVVDDEESIRETIRSFLSSENYNVYTAGDATEALEVYKSLKPGIIILDIYMPGMSGLDLLKIIRENDNQTETIVLTGHGDMNAAVMALKQNATDFLQKPVDMEVLLLAVRKAEEHMRLKNELRAYTMQLEVLFKEVRHNKEFLETIIQNSPNATVTYDRDGIITSWNDEATKITGYPASETIGSALKDIFVFDNHLISHKDGSIGQPRQNVVSQILTRKQRIRIISRNANILRNPENEIIGGIESFYDITEKAKSDRLLEKRYLQVQTINEIGKIVAVSREVKQLLEFIGSGLVKTFFESAQVSFFLYSKSRDKLVLRYTHGLASKYVLDEHPIGGEFDPGIDLIGHVFKTGEAALFAEVRKSSHFEEGLTKDPQSVYALPIKVKKRIFGIFTIENSVKMELDDADIFMLEAIAEYLAIAFERIELMEQITSQNQLLEKQASELKEALTNIESQQEIIVKQNEKMIQDLKKAGDFQKSLLPSRLPEHKNYRFSASFSPSSQLGGDYYDVFPIDERYIGVMVADASGHGVASAMLSAMFKMTLGKYAPTDLDPASVFSKLNKDFCNVLQMGDFFTAFYAIIDTRTKRLIYSNAAHPLPLLYHYDSDEVISLDSEGFLLGVMDTITYEKKQFEFSGRYRLLIYTDGLPEAIDKKERQYGEEKVKENLKKYAAQKPRDYLGFIVEDLKKYTGSDSFEDDLTLVVMDIDV